ncbi:unnamed protein product, partial [Peniophora sp. CBMAI 1063]
DSISSLSSGPISARLPPRYRRRKLRHRPLVQIDSSLVPGQSSGKVARADDMLEVAASGAYVSSAKPTSKPQVSNANESGVEAPRLDRTPDERRLSDVNLSDADPSVASSSTIGLSMPSSSDAGVGAAHDADSCPRIKKRARSLQHLDSAKYILLLRKAFAIDVRRRRDAAKRATRNTGPGAPATS